MIFIWYKKFFIEIYISVLRVSTFLKNSVFHKNPTLNKQVITCNFIKIPYENLKCSTTTIFPFEIYGLFFVKIHENSEEF